MPQPNILPSSLWQTLLPSCIAVFETTSFTHSPFLHPQEALAVQNAVPKRREEFAAGRACARHALAALGCVAAPLPRGADRRPVWPEGITGSITHTQGYCAAAVAKRRDIMSIGIDAEMIGSVDDDVLHLICTPAERTRLAAMDRAQRAEAATIVFSAKEAFFKCQAAAGGYLTSFQDVELQWQTGGWQTGEFVIGTCRQFTLASSINAPLKGRYLVCDGMVLTGIALRQL